MKHCLRPHKAGFIEPWTSAGSIVTGDKIGRADWDGSEMMKHSGSLLSLIMTGSFGQPASSGTMTPRLYDSPTVYCIPGFVLVLLHLHHTPGLQY